MLGRLSKWLRIMGVDCEYVRAGPPEEIAERALSEDRILLSRDTRLLSRKRLGRHLFIESDHLERQVLQVLGAFQIDPLAQAFNRCIRCNIPLQEASFEHAGARVPDFVQQTQGRLAYCRGCNRYYWGATHRSRMRRRLEDYRRALETGD
jgi:uncharacterized protein with PIN domain